MQIKFIFTVFEHYLFALGDLHMGICTGEIKCKWGSPYAKLPKKTYFGPFFFLFADGLLLLLLNHPLLH
jgi:hypothetical protein